MAALGDRRDFTLEPVPENLLRDPIEHMLADVYRLQKVCDLLEEISMDPESPDARGRATAVLAFMETDLPRHLDDESTELLPRLRNRCDLEGVAEDLGRTASKNHLATRNGIAHLRGVLEPFVRLGSLGSDGDPYGVIQDFTLTQRRNLAWERDVVLPLARRYLMESDLSEMGRSMAARRGVPYPNQGIPGQSV